VTHRLADLDLITATLIQLIFQAMG